MRKLALLFASLVAMAAVACSSDTAPTDPVDVTPDPLGTATVVTAQTTSPPSETNVPATDVPQSGTEVVPSATLPVPTPPSVIPALEFVDNADCRDISRTQLPLADVEITDGTRTIALVAEMAVSPAEQSQGLMCRETVPAGTGMLFIWEEERAGGFWMFNSYAPLDIIYFGAKDGRVSLKQMTPCPRGEDEIDGDWNFRCGRASAPYRPGIMYTTTLELPQGWLESQGFNTADPSDIVVSLSARE